MHKNLEMVCQHLNNKLKKLLNLFHTKKKLQKKNNFPKKFNKNRTNDDVFPSRQQNYPNSLSTHNKYKHLTLTKHNN